MKKIVLLLMATLMIAYTEAQTIKLQFVMWKNGVPSYNDGQILACKTKAIKGEPIPNAEVRATPANYKQAWGEAGYNFLLSAPESDFTVGPSDGTEDNWGIENGVAVITGKLSPGVKVIKYKGVSIAKWGTNGCLNPLTVPVKADPVDLDNYAGNPVNNNSGKNTGGPNTGGITNTINVTPGNNNGGNNEEQELSYRKGIKIFAEGANFYADVQRETVSLLRQNPIGCCGGSGGATTAPTLYATTPSQIIQQPAGQQQSLGNGGTIQVYQKLNWTDVAGVLLQTANVGLNAVNTFRGYNVNLNGRNMLFPTNNPTIIGGSGTGFQGYNQQTAVYDNTWNRNVNQQVTTVSNIASLVSGNGTGLVTIGN